MWTDVSTAVYCFVKPNCDVVNKQLGYNGPCSLSDVKVKEKSCIAVRANASPLRELTQCYLPPGRGDIPAFTPAEAGTQFSDSEGMQG